MPDRADSNDPVTAAADEACAFVDRLRRGERLAIARVATELERSTPLAPRLLRAMQPHLGQARVVGITGPPGAGKSTLVNALIRALRERHETVGVIAVDPSSPVSGGAILGDRIRMTAAMDDDGVFIRSLASRGYLGGLSPAAVRVIDALDAAGKSMILIETVGTGQNEIDIAEIADVRVVITAPGLGDGIQAMKAGLIEIADILVVNKCDREGAERTAEELTGSLALRARDGGAPPILKTSAMTGVGIADLLAAIDVASQRAQMQPSVERRRRRARYLVARAAADLVAERIKAGGTQAVEALTDQVLAGDITPAQAALRLL
jgi:LAO/AO transport system kinase